MEPTKRQVEYAKYLAYRMCEDLPKEYTWTAYSEFINRLRPLVKSEDDAMNEPDVWGYNYM